MSWLCLYHVQQMAFTALADPVKSRLLQKCRDARSLILRDSEAYIEATQTLEHVGQVISGKIGKGLGAYRDSLWEPVKLTRLERHDYVRLFNVVKDARNDAVHNGAWARHISTRLIDLILLIEEGLTMSLTRVKDLMVRDPVSAEWWELLYSLRRKILETSFSHLPVLGNNSTWLLVSETNLMLFLRSDPIERRAMTLKEAVANGLDLILAPTCHEEDLANEVLTKTKEGPLLVTDVNKPERLLGILTAFDLL